MDALSFKNKFISADAERPAPSEVSEIVKPHVSKLVKPEHGTTTLAFKFQGGIIVAVDSRATAGSYIASQTTKKIIEINKYLIGTMAGGAADCMYWERVLSRECELYELKNGRRISVRSASKILSDLVYPYRNYGLSMGTMIAGWDDDGADLYYVDSDGSRLRGNLFSVGSGSTLAYGILDSEFNYEMSVEDAILVAKKAIFHATHRDAYSGGVVRVYHIDNEGWKVIGVYDTMNLYEEYMSHEE